MCPTLCDPMDYRVYIGARLLCPWNSPGKNTGVGCHDLLQGIFPTHGSNPGLVHCRQILYYLSHQGSPKPTNKENATAFKHRSFPECMLFKLSAIKERGLTWERNPVHIWLQRFSSEPLETLGGSPWCLKSMYPVESGNETCGVGWRAGRSGAPLLPGQKHSLLSP